MKTLTIEWKHPDRDGGMRDRCRNSGRMLRKTVRRPGRTSQRYAVRLRLEHQRLTGPPIPESHAIRIIGRPPASFLGGIKAHGTACDSRSELLGKPASCRALRRAGKDVGTFTSQWIREEACHAAQCKCAVDAAYGF